MLDNTCIIKSANNFLKTFYHYYTKNKIFHKENLPLKIFDPKNKSAREILLKASNY